jgi:hypothetical protein
MPSLMYLSWIRGTFSFSFDPSKSVKAIPGLRVANGDPSHLWRRPSKSSHTCHTRVVLLERERVHREPYNRVGSACLATQLRTLGATVERAYVLTPAQRKDGGCTGHRERSAQSSLAQSSLARRFHQRSRVALRGTAAQHLSISCAHVIDRTRSSGSWQNSSRAY